MGISVTPHETLRMALVMGLSGCTATGKTTLAKALQRSAPDLLHVCCDDYYLPPEYCPQFDMVRLPWPGDGRVPQAFRQRGSADLNVPESVDWLRVEEAVKHGVNTLKRPVLIDGALLFGNHPGSQRVLNLCDRVAVLWADDNERCLTELRRRKWVRSRPGRRSYRERGVSAEQYAAYFNSYVWPTWLQHGASRVPANSVRIDCMQPTVMQLSQLTRCEWFDDIQSRCE